MQLDWGPQTKQIACKNKGFLENVRQEDSSWPKPSRWLEIMKLETAVENHLR